MNHIVPILVVLMIALLNLGVFLLLKDHANKRFTELSLLITNDFTKLTDFIQHRLVEMTEEVRTQVIQAVKHLDDHAGHLMQETENLRIHAKLVVDVNAASETPAHITDRQICNHCRRLVHKFEKTHDGVFCIDCLSKRYIESTRAF